MRTRVFYSKIWSDSFFMKLNPQEKLLFIYFLTNEAINIIHLYEVSIEVIMFATKLDEETIENAKNKFQANNKLHFYKDFVYIVNAYRYQKYNGERNNTARDTLFSQLPKDVLDWFYSISDTPISGVYIPPEIKTKIKYKTIIKTNEEEMEEVLEGVN